MVTVGVRKVIPVGRVGSGRGEVRPGARSPRWHYGNEAVAFELACSSGSTAIVQNTRILGRQRRRFKVQLGMASGFTADVSAGGFCAELMRVFPKGTAVKGTIVVDGREYDFSGRVSWAKQGDFRLN